MNEHIVFLFLTNSRLFDSSGSLFDPFTCITLFDKLKRPSTYYYCLFILPLNLLSSLSIEHVFVFINHVKFYRTGKTKLLKITTNPYHFCGLMSKLHSLSNHDICITFQQNFTYIKAKHRVKLNHKCGYKT